MLNYNPNRCGKHSVIYIGVENWYFLFIPLCIWGVWKRSLHRIWEETEDYLSVFPIAVIKTMSNSPRNKEIILFYRPQPITDGSPDRKSSQEPRDRDLCIVHETMLLTDLLSMACSNYLLTSHKITSYKMT